MLSPTVHFFSSGSDRESDKLDMMFADEMNSLDDNSVTCMMLHPVSYPNHGAEIELSLASEALGLVSSLDWEIECGPNRHENILKNDANEGE